MSCITRQMLPQRPIALEVVKVITLHGLHAWYNCVYIVCEIEIPGLPCSDFSRYFSLSDSLLTSFCWKLFLLFYSSFKLSCFDINEFKFQLSSVIWSSNELP